MRWTRNELCKMCNDCGLEVDLVDINDRDGHDHFDVKVRFKNIKLRIQPSLESPWHILVNVDTYEDVSAPVECDSLSGWTIALKKALANKKLAWFIQAGGFEKAVELVRECLRVELGKLGRVTEPKRQYRESWSTFTVRGVGKVLLWDSHSVNSIHVLPKWYKGQKGGMYLEKLGLDIKFRLGESDLVALAKDVAKALSSVPV